MKKKLLLSAVGAVVILAGISLSLSKETKSQASLMLNQVEAFTNPEESIFTKFTAEKADKSCPVYGLVWENGKYVSKIVRWETKSGRKCSPGSSTCVPYAPC